MTVRRQAAPPDERPVAPPGDTAVIELERVSRYFGDTVAVRDASVEVAHGEFFSLLGPSGCGKTTTLRMIAGFELPSSGTIRLMGEDVSHVPPYRRDVNTVFQHYALFPHMTVAENVAFGPRSQRVGKDAVRRRVQHLLEVVRLQEFTRRKPAQLSGGQQQRVALARALVNFPKALLLDEPLGALDLKLRQAMQLELKRIQREVGVAFVYVTHDQEEALTMSDRIAVVNEGSIEQIGTPEEIYVRPASVFVAGFIGQANLWEADVVGPDGDDMQVEALGTRLQATVPSGLNGGPISLMVRPEQVRVLSEAPPGGRGVQVVVKAVLFQGPVIRLAAEAADGSEVVAHLTAGSDVPRIQPGDAVWCTWDPSSAVAVSGRARPTDAEA